MGPLSPPNFNRGIVERAYESLSLREKGFLFDHASQARAGVAPAGVQRLSRRTVTATTGRVVPDVLFSQSRRLRQAPK